MTATHLSQRELARRFGISPRTLERWRWRGEGPRFMKLGGRVVYRVQDVEAFEAERLRELTTDGIGEVLYEEVRAHRGTLAAQIYGAFLDGFRIEEEKSAVAIATAVRVTRFRHSIEEHERLATYPSRRPRCR